MKNKDKKAVKPELTPEQKHQRNRSIKIISAALGILLILSAVGYFVIKQILGGDGNAAEEFTALVDRNPAVGALVLFVMTVVQVVIAFIPGELIEQVAGVLFDPFFGTLICLAGSLLGSTLVILLVRKFGRSVVYALYSQEKIESNSFMQSGKKRNVLTAMLFFIPGTPKDLLTYIIALTDMKLGHYLLLTGIARVPSILMSTISGGLLRDVLSGEAGMRAFIIWNAASVALCAVGYVIYIGVSKLHRRVRGRAARKNDSDSDSPKR